MKKCPFCAEDIQDTAIKCRYCQSLLNDSSPTPLAVSKDIINIQDEKELDKIHPAWIHFFGVFFLAGVLLLFIAIHWSFLLISIALIIGAIMVRNSTIYTITTQRVIVQRGILSKQRDDIDIKDMRSITTKQNIGQSFIGCGDILIGTAGTAGDEIVICDITDHQKYADLIRAQK